MTFTITETKGLRVKFKKPVAFSLLIEVTRDGDDYIAQPAYYDGRAVDDNWVKGVADTPLEAVYDACEIIAEWGLDGEGRDYPPAWYLLLWWQLMRPIERLWRRITR